MDKQVICLKERIIPTTKYSGTYTFNDYNFEEGKIYYMYVKENSDVTGNYNVYEKGSTHGYSFSEYDFGNHFMLLSLYRQIRIQEIIGFQKKEENVEEIVEIIEPKVVEKNLFKWIITKLNKVLNG